MVSVRIIRMHQDKGRAMSKERWIEGVKGALDDSSTVSLEDYHDGLMELSEEIQERYQLASDDLERAGEVADEEAEEE